MAETKKYESVWFAETRFAGEGLIPLASIAAHTKRIRLAPGILGHTYARSAVLTALSFVTLDIVSNGRAIVGLGPGASYYLNRQGLERSKPLATMKEYVDVLRKLMNGGIGEYSGEVVRIRDVRFQIKPVQNRIPIYLGVSGPKMLTLSGQIADGVLLNALTSPIYAMKAIGHVREGLEFANREKSSFDVAGIIYVSIDKNGTKARDVLKPLLADYFLKQPHTARDSGVSDEVLSALRSGSRVNGIEAAAKVIPDDVVSSITAAGTPEECQDKIDEYRKAGIELPVIFPLPPHGEKAVTYLS